ncbi:MAG: NAD(P)-dependent oxidoreductase [Mucinivorans sp.]
MSKKKRILLTGATGVMGWAALRELLKRTDRFLITILCRPSKVNQRKLAPLAQNPYLKIVWGDLANYTQVLEAVTDADYVLHVGGVVPPAADYNPLSTLEVNVTAAENIVRAVKAQKNGSMVKVVYIGTVAQTSERNAPVHWGRTGDPICISTHDHYALSKTIAERTIVDGGLSHWVCLRLSGILYPGILKNYDPIIFRVPLQGVLEWVTVEDSARMLAEVCQESVPDEFWNRFYHVGSGESFRMSNYEFEQKLLHAISCPKVEKIFEANWFALRNFHGLWCSDSDVLDGYLHFREGVSCQEYFERLSRQMPWFYRLAKIVPAPIIKYCLMRPLAYRKERGTMDWIRQNNKELITVYFGTMVAWQAIGHWGQVDTTPPTKQVRLLNHGYDETKPLGKLAIEDMQQAAAFRGGQCLSQTMKAGDMATKLKWRCHCGHEFRASAALVLLGGHWCPECMPAPWDYDSQAQHNPFFAQVWLPTHGTEENHRYESPIYEKWKNKHHDE